MLSKLNVAVPKESGNRRPRLLPPESSPWYRMELLSLRRMTIFLLHTKLFLNRVMSAAARGEVVADDVRLVALLVSFLV